MNKMNPKVDEYLSKARWREEMEKLRAILLDSSLTEEFKWGVPCYTFQQSNIVGMNGLKESCALAFFKGVLLKDPDGILVKPGKSSQSARWMKFTSVREIAEMKPVLRAYIQEAIEAERAGLKVKFEKNPEPIPKELQDELNSDPALKTAFGALTPGRQRGYVLHVSAAKQSETRESRVENCRERILSGKGFHDCICGHSKKKPRCDGSHQYI
jgi:uncharacterized protein YdeI (YjbR/CyaY-like superfamily)